MKAADAAGLDASVFEVVPRMTGKKKVPKKRGQQPTLLAAAAAARPPPASPPGLNPARRLRGGKTIN
jgi:hypothetical protein